MNQVIRIRYQLLSIILLSICHSASALDFEVRSRLETGFIYYSFEQEQATNIVPPIDDQGNLTVLQDTFSISALEFEDTVPFIGGGVTLFMDRFFVDLSAQKAFNGSDDNVDQQTSSFFEIPGDNGISTVTSFTDRSWDIDFDRTEYAVSLGYAVTERLALFAGYKKSETERSEKDPNRQAITFIDGNIAAQGVLSLEFESETEYDGPFIGAVYGWDVNQGFLNGTLSANIAIAFLDAELHSKRTFGQNLTTGEIIPNETFPTLKGDTTGVTFGLNWTGLTPVEQLTYSVGFSGHDYSFDSDSVFANFDETVLTFKLGVAYSF